MPNTYLSRSCHVWPGLRIQFSDNDEVADGRPRAPQGPYTLLEFQILFQNVAFRKHLLETMADDQVRDMLREGERVLYGESKPENMAPYVTSKMGRFVHDSLLRRVVGHGSMAVNVPTIMDQQKVLLVKLGRGRFGQNVADLVAAQLVLRFRVAAMQRSAIPERSRKPFFLYVDEIGSLRATKRLRVRIAVRI